MLLIYTNVSLILYFYSPKEWHQMVILGGMKGCCLTFDLNNVSFWFGSFYFVFVCLFVCFEAGFHYVAQAVLELAILLCQPAECTIASG
jgi:hypothetical protein